MMSEPVPLWEVGARAIADHRDDAGGGWEHPDDIWRIYTPFAEWVIAAVEPLIRADERDRNAEIIDEQRILLDGWITERIRLQHIITELREQIRELEGQR